MDLNCAKMELKSSLADIDARLDRGEALDLDLQDRVTFLKSLVDLDEMESLDLSQKARA